MHRSTGLAVALYHLHATPVHPDIISFSDNLNLLRAQAEY